MTVNRTTLLDLPLPVTGTESGTWGDTTNNGLTQYVDIAIAGMSNLTSANFTAGALTIETTEGDSSATNISATSAQYAGFRVSSLAVNSTITVGNTGTSPARSYRLINADATYSLTFKATGQTGVTLLPGQSAVVAFNGTDYVIVGVVGAGTATDNAVARFDGTTGEILQSSGVTIDDSNNVSGVAQLNITTLDATNIEVTNIKAKDGTAAGSIADSTGVVTLASSVLTTTDINGGTIDNTAIGGSTAAAGSFTTLTTSSTVTLNGGTANGVLYLNGSKVATSGSALTFDGNRFAVSASTLSEFRIADTGSATDQKNWTWQYGTGIGAGLLRLRAGNDANTDGQNAYIIARTGINVDSHQWLASGSEQMRLTSTGLGIGTSSPANAIEVSRGSGVPAGISLRGNGNTSGNEFFVGQSSSGDAFVYQRANAPLYFGTNNTTRATLDSSGNLGLGVTPGASNYSGSATVLNVKGNGSNKIGTVLVQSAGTTNATNIELFASDGSNEAGLLTKGAATAMTFYTGSAPDKRMTLDSSGNLGLGVTPSAWGGSFKAFQIASGGTSLWSDGSVAFYNRNTFYDGTNRKYVVDGFAQEYAQLNDGSHAWKITTSGSANGNISFTQAMTLDADGDLGVGITAPTCRLDLAGPSTAGLTNLVQLRTGSGNSFGFQIKGDHSTDGYLVQNYYNSYLAFGTNNTERARITSGGSFCVHDGTLVDSGLVSFAKTTETSVVLAIKNPQYSCDMWATNTSGDNVWARFFSETSATQRGSISYNRTGGLVAYNTTSDYRAKDILGSVTDSGAIIDALKVYEGKMKGATQSRPMLVAHEAQALAPYAVTGEKDAVDDDGNPKYQQMDVSSFVPLLIAELQSLRQRVAQLEGTQP